MRTAAKSSSSSSGSNRRGRERERGASMRSRQPSAAVGASADHTGAAGAVSCALAQVSEALRVASPSDSSRCWSASADSSDSEEDDTSVVREFTLEPAVLSASARGSRRLWSSPEVPRSRQVLVTTSLTFSVTAVYTAHIARLIGSTVCAWLHEGTLCTDS
jgi:hypothetical protein